MRVLARRGTAPVSAMASAARSDERRIVTPKRQASRVIAPEPAPKTERTLVTPPRNRAAERAAAARRRQVLSLLVMVTFFLGLASLVGIVPRVALLIPVVLITAFLVTARLSVRKLHQPYWVEVPVEQEEQESSVVVRRSPVRVSSTRTSTADAPYCDDDEPTITLTAEQRANAAGRPARAASALPTRSTEGGSLWDPVPVSAPVFAAARPAPRTVRTVSIGQSAIAAGAVVADPAFAEADGAETASGSASARPQPDPEYLDDVPKVVNG